MAQSSLGRRESMYPMVFKASGKAERAAGGVHPPGVDLFPGEHPQTDVKGTAGIIVENREVLPRKSGNPQVFVPLVSLQHLLARLPGPVGEALH